MSESNQSNPNARDVVSIRLRCAGETVNIPVFGMTREQAIQAYELMSTSEEVTFACAFVVGGNSI